MYMYVYIHIYIYPYTYIIYIHIKKCVCGGGSKKAPSIYICIHINLCIYIYIHMILVCGLQFTAPFNPEKCDDPPNSPVWNSVLTPDALQSTVQSYLFLYVHPYICVLISTYIYMYNKIQLLPHVILFFLSYLIVLL